ncbi:MAG TPA: RHS repeat-associated core domain-containing protein [Acidobacteriaceae bacterium]|nr:RHS repeat-associated core domain-containing protein [Acidobacteriaceae bacterium]
MQLASGTHIPDGLLAASVLLSENSHQGFEAPTHTLHQGFGFVISHTSLGIISPLYDGDVRSRSTGKERDTESGLDYFKYRMYASSMGRWMSPDPSGLTHADLGNPQSLNLYNYVGNSPLTRTDLDGLCWKGFQWACDAAQSLNNGFHHLGFQTNASVDREQHSANQLLHHDGIQTEGMSRQQVRKAYKLDMALGSVRVGEVEDGTLIRRVRPSAAQARSIWEKVTGGKVPWDETLGRFYDMHHINPGGDGGDWWDGHNMTPMQHGDHVELHQREGDFARWGARGATPEGPADVTVEPAPVPSPVIIEPIEPIP